MKNVSFAMHTDDFTNSTVVTTCSGFTKYEQSWNASHPIKLVNQNCCVIEIFGEKKKKKMNIVNKTLIKASVLVCLVVVDKMF